MSYLAVNNANAHQLPRFGGSRLILLSAEKTAERPVERWVMAFFSFTFFIGEVNRKETISVPFDYDDNEWLIGSASCSLTFPIELRPEALAIVRRYDPFSCP